MDGGNDFYGDVKRMWIMYWDANGDYYRGRPLEQAIVGFGERLLSAEFITSIFPDFKFSQFEDARQFVIDSYLPHILAAIRDSGTHAPSTVIAAHERYRKSREASVSQGKLKVAARRTGVVLWFMVGICVFLGIASTSLAAVGAALTFAWIVAFGQYLITGRLDPRAVFVPETHQQGN